MIYDYFPIFTGDLTYEHFILVFIIKALILAIPANYIIKALMPKYDKKAKSDEARNGMIIGILERILMLSFMYFNQITAIGLVLTCKSITRFKQLENKDFAERYLIGTLLSTLLTVIVFAI